MKPIRSLEHVKGEPPPAAGEAAEDSLPPLLPHGVVSDITHLLVSEGSPDKVLQAVAGALAELVPHDTLTLYQADEPLRLLRPVLVRDAYAQEILAMGAIPYGTGITGTAAETRVPQLVNDAHLDARAMQVPGTPNEPESLLAVPLLARDELKGVLCLYRVGEGNHFSIKEFKLAVVFSDLAALAIDNAQIRAKLEAEVVTDHLTALYNHRYFHERLAEELRRSNRQRSSVGLVLYDIDDFKRVNDTYGHLVGDQVLQGVASISRETCRLEDVICRIGGEEFAVILPGASVSEAAALAERLRTGIESIAFPTVGPITVSVGVAEGPLHAASPRDLMTCADIALLEAKTKGKNRVQVFGEEGGDGDASSAGEAKASGWTTSGWNGPALGGHLSVLAARGEARSVGQLRMLQSLSARLNRLNDIREIGEAITAELRSIIDYHNCRVFLLEPDGETLLPIAFRGELSEYQGETFEALITKVGEGVTGHVALTGESYYTPDAEKDPHAETIAGTPDVDESLLAVPLRYGDRIIGVIVLSKLGIDQFDTEDRRLLEGLAAGAAVAFENARLLRVEHEAAEVSGALLRLSQALTKGGDTQSVLAEALSAIPSMVRCSAVGAWIRDQETGAFRLVSHQGFDPKFERKLAEHVVPAETAGRFLVSLEEPFVLPREVVATVPPEYQVMDRIRETLVAPVRWEPDGLGALVMVAPEVEASFFERDLRLARGIADITSLALGNTQRFLELERTYVSTVEALANALEAKDAYAGDHARALAEMALAVGVEIGLEGERLKHLELAALFHDIGKIGVPSEILHKPGPLTAAERKEMTRHPEIGEQILAPVSFLQPVRPVVRACHERWDGKGYPDGLSGEDIPLEARIVFVCDAFHAMTTDRPYRKALPEKEAIRRLKLASGTQFDASVVKAFIRLYEAGGITFYVHHH